MATNHTEQYGLNLWEPQDKFVRTEFNENTEKIEAALCGLAQTKAEGTETDALRTDLAAVKGRLDTAGPYRLVRMVTLSAPALQLSLSVVGVSLFQYYKLDLFLDCPGACGATYLRLNGRSDQIYVHTGGGNGSSSIGSFSDHLVSWPTTPGQPPTGLVSFTLPMRGGNVTCFAHNCAASTGSVQFSLCGGSTPSINWENLTSIDVVCEKVFPAGSKAALYGLRK